VSVPIRILMLEDSEDDAALLLRELRQGGYEPECKRVDTAPEMGAALDSGQWDLVISDHSMPGFSANAGLALLHERGIDVPFIIVSGTIHEEAAVEAMAAGAGDYVFKDNLARLVPAIERELRDAVTRATQREAELALRESESRLQAVMANVVDAIVTTDAMGTIESVNPGAEHLFGYRASELVGEGFGALLSEQHRPQYAGYIRDYGLGQPMSILGLTREVQGRRRDSTTLPIELALSEMRLGDKQMLIAICRSISERKRAEAQLQYLADHDPLTDLPNRRSFEQELARGMSYAARYGTGGAVLVLDIDNFKYVNDSLGHKAGDELIRRVAELIRSRLRDSDALARLGGDEFAVLLHASEPQAAHDLAEDLVRIIRRHRFILGGQGTRVSASIGFAPLGDDQASGGELLAQADLAMYAAKEAGRDRVAEFTREGQEQLDAGRTWSDRIRHALEQDLLVLHWQPILDLRTQEVSQYELLLRMQAEDGRLVPPGAFLATAERFGLIQQIDRWVVRQAVRLVAAHERAGRQLLIEVNLSGKSMNDRDLLPLIEEELSRTPIEPSSLIFEVTETAAVADIDQARRFAQSLTDLGCRFALDDFGAGFASFYYLKHLPIAYLKIDGDFIRDLPRTPIDQLVVKALVQISQGLGIKTIAEFVEDQETLAFLENYGVDYAQGYHIGRPTPIPEIEPMSLAQSRAGSAS
jgi:diguanylate cyclase (GGDEF)-like protein/PAS domain S-box-containing protein